MKTKGSSILEFIDDNLIWVHDKIVQFLQKHLLIEGEKFYKKMYDLVNKQIDSIKVSDTSNRLQGLLMKPTGSSILEFIGNNLSWVHNKIVYFLESYLIIAGEKFYGKIYDLVDKHIESIIDKYILKSENEIEYIETVSAGFQYPDSFQKILNKDSYLETEVEVIKTTNPIIKTKELIESDIPKDAKCRRCQSKIVETFNDLGGVVICRNCGHIQHKKCIDQNKSRCNKCYNNIK
jgi:hypothetical protein